NGTSTYPSRPKPSSTSPFGSNRNTHDRAATTILPSRWMVSPYVSSQHRPTSAPVAFPSTPNEVSSVPFGRSRAIEMSFEHPPPPHGPDSEFPVARIPPSGESVRSYPCSYRPKRSEERRVGKEWSSGLG